MADGDRRRFQAMFDGALRRYCAGGKTQKDAATEIVERQTRRLRLFPDDRAHRITVWEKRLSGWKSGKSLPRDEADLRLAVGVVASGSLAEEWVLAWKSARATRGRPTQRPGETSAGPLADGAIEHPRADEVAGATGENSRPAAPPARGITVATQAATPDARYSGAEGRRRRVLEWLYDWEPGNPGLVAEVSDLLDPPELADPHQSSLWLDTFQGLDADALIRFSYRLTLEGSTLKLTDAGRRRVESLRVQPAGPQQPVTEHTVAHVAAEGAARTVVLDRWVHDTGGRAPNALTLLGDNRVDHPGYAARTRTEAPEPPAVRYAAVIACTPLPPDRPSTSQLRARFLQFLARITPSLVAAHTYVGAGVVWQPRPGWGRNSLEAVLTTEGSEEEPPLATARLTPATTDRGTGLDTPRYTQFVLRIEPRTSGGQPAPAVPLAQWPERFATALGELPPALGDLLTHGLGLTIHPTPFPAFGVWLQPTTTLLDLVDITGFSALPGSRPMQWFTAYAVGIPGGDNPWTTADHMMIQMCDHGLQLDQYETPLAASHPLRQLAPSTGNTASVRVAPDDPPADSAPLPAPRGDALRSERLRGLSEALMTFALVLERVCCEKGYLLDGEDEGQRDERHQLELTEGQRQVGEALPKLLIEPGLADIVEAHQAVYRAGDQLLRSWRLRSEYPGSMGLEEHRRLVQELECSIAELQERVQAKVAGL